MRLPTVLFNLIKLNPISNKIYLNPLSPFFFIWIYIKLYLLIETSHIIMPHFIKIQALKIKWMKVSKNTCKEVRENVWIHRSIGCAPNFMGSILCQDPSSIQFLGNLFNGIWMMQPSWWYYFLSKSWGRLLWEGFLGKWQSLRKTIVFSDMCAAIQGLEPGKQ